MKRKRTKAEIAGLSSGGIRRKFRDDLRDDRAERPRRLARNFEEYLANVEARPLFGLHRAALATEHLLWCARYGKPAFRRYLSEAERLFFAVRTEESVVLKNDGVVRRPDRKTVARLRETVRGFADDCLALRRRMGTLRKVTCPCCHGTGRVYELNDSAVRAVLDRAVEAGLIGYSPLEGYHGL